MMLRNIEPEIEGMLTQKGGLALQVFCSAHASAHKFVIVPAVRHSDCGGSAVFDSTGEVESRTANECRNEK